MQRVMACAETKSTRGGRSPAMCTTREYNITDGGKSPVHKHIVVSDCGVNGRKHVVPSQARCNGIIQSWDDSDSGRVRVLFIISYVYTGHTKIGPELDPRPWSRDLRLHVRSRSEVCLIKLTTTTH